MIITLPKYGDRKSKESICIFPLYYKDKIYWFEKVKKIYEFRDYMLCEGKWILIGVDAKNESTTKS
jgi:hypothetical protein